MNLLDLLILALATWRLAYFVTRESAPYEVMAKTRQRYPLGGLLTCIYCMSIWCAGVLYVLWVLLPAVNGVIMILAVSGLALMLAKYSGVDYTS